MSSGVISCRAEDKKPDEPAAEVKKPDPAGAVVEVDAAVITEGDVSAKLDQIQAMFTQRGVNPAQLEMMLPHFREQIIEELVARALIDNECAKRRIIVNKDELAPAIEGIKASIPEGEDFDELMKQQGITREALETEMRDQLKLVKLLNISEPTEDEIRVFYDENKSEYFEKPETIKARHILIAFGDEDTDDDKAAKRAKIEDVKKQLSEGADFADAAGKISDCPSKAKGGDLGEFSKGRMVPEFEKAAFSQKVDEIGPIVETEYGYHIIQVTEHRDAETQPYEKAKSRIPFLIKGKALSEKADGLIKDLREKAKITYKAGAAPAKQSAVPVPAPAM